MAPWTKEEFARKHWKKAKVGQASKAARTANAILRSGGKEGIAIATGIARAKGQGPIRQGRKRKGKK